MKKHTLSIFLILCVFVFVCSSCEKAYNKEEDKSEQTPEKGDSTPTDDKSTPAGDEGTPTGDDGTPAGDDSTPSTTEYLTIAEFIEGFEGKKNIEGYIVGDCTKSMKNANFTPPFSQPQAILLADNIDERDKAKIIPVQLKSGYKVRTLLNLQDHPENLHKKLRFTGSYGTYMKVPGCTDISSSFQLLDK